MMITVGDTVHNFVDGVMIAAAFLVDMKLGVVTAFAIAATRCPRNWGLPHPAPFRLHKTKALVLNLLSSAAMLLGAVLGYFLLAEMHDLLPLHAGASPPPA